MSASDTGGATPSGGRDGSGPPRDRLEAYAADLFVREDPLLAELRAETRARGLPEIQVPARTGLLLQILLRATGARRVVEVGTLGGYSALWMARALPAGSRLITLERDEDHADLAAEFVRRAGLSEAIEIRRGDARRLLPEVGPDGSIDLVFVDADKEGYPAYLQQARRLLRPGGLLVADNAFWKGRVLGEADPDDAPTQGVRLFNRTLASDPEFNATILPVGDGIAVAVRR